MSLMQSIKTRRLEDLINEGQRVFLTNTFSGADVTNFVLETLPVERALVITSICLTCDQAIGPYISLSWRKGSAPAIPFFVATMAQFPLPIVYPPGQWIYGDLNYDLVITTFGLTGNLCCTINGRFIAEKAPLNYTEHDGASGHAAPWFPDPNGRLRGQSEV
jgi:hypothetical protein